MEPNQIICSMLGLSAESLQLNASYLDGQDQHESEKWSYGTWRSTAPVTIYQGEALLTLTLSRATDRTGYGYRLQNGATETRQARCFSSLLC